MFYKWVYNKRLGWPKFLSLGTLVLVNISKLILQKVYKTKRGIAGLKHEHIFLGADIQT